MRILLRGAVVLLLIPLAALRGHADERPFRLADLEVVPVHELEWGVLLLERPELVLRLQLLGERARKLAAHLAAREDPVDAGSRALRHELAGLEASLAPTVAALREALHPLGVTPEVWSVVAAAPAGPMRVERHAMRLPLLLDGVGPRVRALHARLVPATEGALLALRGARDELPDAATDARASLEQRMQRIRTRFWRVLDATLDRDQRTALRRRLPGPVAKPVDLLSHVFLLPDLAPAQAARLKSLLVRVEAESAPDAAAVQRIEARLGDTGLDAATRAALEREKRATQRRSLERAVQVWRDGVSLLTEEQRAELVALPPYLSAQARVGDLEHDLARIEWRPEQQASLDAFVRRHAGLKGRMVQQLAIAERRARDAGPDGPRREEVEMMRYRAYADALRSARGAVHELFTDLLEPDQVLVWVLDG